MARSREPRSERPQRDSVPGKEFPSAHASTDETPAMTPPSAEAAPSLRLPGPFGNVSPGQASTMVQTSLLGALQGLQELTAQASEEIQASSKKHMQAIQAALRYVHKTFPSEELPDKAQDATRDWAIDPERAQAFGQMVERARRKAEMSAGKLAKRAGLSEQTIYNVEAATNIPTHATVVRLLAVKELGLDSDQVPWRRVETAETGSSPNCWIAPGYEPLKLFTELFELLNNSRGGSIEQTYSYLDHQSAMNFSELSNQSAYATTFRDNMPLELMAQSILESTGRAKLDVIALGSGDGKQEVRLVRHLLAHHAHQHESSLDTRLFLLDISQPLLSSAYQHAATTLRPHGVYVCAVQGNFHHWPQYTQLHYTPERAHRRRLVTMLGNTLGNLDNEVRFFQHTLIGFVPGDLLLLDLQLACGAPEHPDEIRRNDKLLINKFQPGHRQWLSGPLRRYIADAIEVDLEPVLDVRSNVIPGAYTIDTVATVKLKDGRQKRFSIFRFKRYDPKRFADTMRHLGWELLEEALFGPTPNTPVHALLLLRRLSPSRPG